MSFKILFIIRSLVSPIITSNCLPPSVPHLIPPSSPSIYPYPPSRFFNMAVACLCISGDILIRLIYELPPSLRPLPKQSLVVHGYGRAGPHQGILGRKPPPSITNQQKVERGGGAQGEELNEK